MTSSEGEVREESEGDMKLSCCCKELRMRPAAPGLEGYDPQLRGKV